MDEAIRVEIQRIHDEDIRQNHRLDKLEDTVDSLKELNLSVQKLALTMEQMLEAQKDISQKVDKLEREPAEVWSNTKKTIFNNIVGAFAGALGAGILWLISQGI